MHANIDFDGYYAMNLIININDFNIVTIIIIIIIIIPIIIIIIVIIIP